VLKARRNFTFKKELTEFKNQGVRDNSFKWAKVSPVLSERNEEGGIMKGAYFHQDLYVAQKIFESKPIKHLDIGSRVDGFVAHVASFRKIEIIDIRPITSSVTNISFRQADLMLMPEELTNYYDSVSSLHAIEHFGLGRYGDPIDYFGHIKAINNIAKILKTDGIFYFSVPMGPQRIEFNEQRVFSLKYLLNLVKSSFKLISFAYVNDAGELIIDAELTDKYINNNFNCYCGCAIFTLKKL
jgi:SAM-dependent methyltransferase